MVSKCQFATKLLFIGLISFLMISLSLPLGAQDDPDDHLEMENEGTIDHDTWNIYGKHFEHIVGPSFEDIEILKKTGHIMLQSDLIAATEGFEIELMFVLNVEDLDKLFTQLNEAGKMPSKFDDILKTKLLLARYVILPTIISKRKTIRVDASMYPVKEGATSISCAAFFKENEIFSGVRHLAKIIAEEIFEKEGIDFTAKKINPIVGIRDFKNISNEEKYDSYITLIPKVINTRLAGIELSKFQLNQANISKDDYDLSDTEIASQKGLDILISGYFFRTRDTMQIACDVMYSSGKTITSKRITAMEENLYDKIDELADEIGKKINSKLE